MTLIQVARAIFPNAEPMWFGRPDENSAAIDVGCGMFIVTQINSDDFWDLCFYEGDNYQETGEPDAALDVPLKYNPIAIIDYLTEPPEGVDHAAWVKLRMEELNLEDFLWICRCGEEIEEDGDSNWAHTSDGARFCNRPTLEEEDPDFMAELPHRDQALRYAPDDQKQPASIWKYSVNDGNAYLEGVSDATDLKSGAGYRYGWFTIEMPEDEADAQLAELGFSPEQIARAKAAG